MRGEKFFIAASNHNMNYLNNVSLNVCGTQLKPSNFVRNLGVYFDSNMTMSNHISSLTRSLNFNLRNIGRIRRYIDEDIHVTVQLDHFIHLFSHA